MASHQFSDCAARRLSVSWLLSLLLGVGVASIAPIRAAELAKPVTERTLPQRLVLALDGIPYDVFAELQQQGRLRDFRPVARMVSTFPSLSDVAFAAIDGHDPPQGYQYSHFDPASNKVVGHTIASLSDRSHPKVSADSTGHSTLHRLLGYLAAGRVAQRDLRGIRRDFLRSRKETFVAYVGTSDAVLHLEGRAGAERFLVQLDRFLADLQAEVLARSGHRLLVDIVSDHGSTMRRGRLLPVERELASCGFPRSKQLPSGRGAAYPLPGIVGSIAVSVLPEHVDKAAQCLARLPGVDLVAVGRGNAVGMLSADGEAEVRQLPGATERYEYRALRGDPLGLLGADDQRTRVFDQATVFTQTLDAPRPDPLRRLWRAFHGDVQHPSPILVSLADGVEAGNPALFAFAGLRGGTAGTHGSMTRLASLGILASNWRDVQDVGAREANQVLFGPEVLAAMRRQIDSESVSIENAGR